MEYPKNKVNQRHKEECSFLKKRTKRLLCLRQRMDPGHGRRGGSGGKSKSLLVLFFRKEHSSFLTP
jgi:hypothetical protein